VPDVTIPAELENFFENSPIALTLASSGDDTPLVLINRRFLELTGYARQDLLHRNCRVLQRDADDRDARAKLRAFLADDTITNVRTPIVNFKKDGTPFVNLLYMSRLRALSGETRFIFASQFDISRAQPERLQAYDQDLGQTLTRLSPVVAESGIIVEGTLTTVANSAHAIAQAKLILANLDDSSIL
jgi:PAS domain S-box-containing protein